MGFSEKVKKFEKIFVILDRRVLWAQQRTCQKVNEDFSKQMWLSCILQTLMSVWLWNFKDGGS